MTTITKKRSLAGLALAGAAAMLLAGCASADNGGTPTTTTPPEGVDYKACMVSDAGGFQDNSFNQSAHEGLLAAEKNLGIKMADAESRDEGDFVTNINSLIGEGCNLIVTVGFLLEQATEDAAKANPEVDFVLIDATLSDENFAPVILPNVKSIVYDTAQAAYLAGYLAAGQSKTGTVATYAGMLIPSVTIFMDGFADGVAAYNKAKGTSVKVLGWDKASQNGSAVGNFDDQLAGQTLTEGFLAQGADIIFPVAGPVGHGTIAAVENAGSKASIIWVDADGFLTVPAAKGLFLSSVLKQMTQAIEDVIGEAVKGKFSNEAYVGTLSNGGVDLAPFHDHDADVSADMKKELDALKADIISGKLKVESPAQAAL
ncbi:MAG: BMP family ABC transporter substrate-binding protein [Microbacteriaceae bacterium]